MIRKSNTINFFLLKIKIIISMSAVIEKLKFKIIVFVSGIWNIFKRKIILIFLTSN